MKFNLLTYIRNLVSLREDTDVRGTIDSIRNSIFIRGYNVWILACGAMLASIGIDVNSPAVIIGAMLISPLMSPILGIGWLSIGINDRHTLFKSLESFGIAVGASLLMSTLYFSFTPLGYINEEILNRTEPTILDVLIAFFGGIAGIVAGSRKDKTNAIPGVAIATALMPPVCVAGYGLAKFNFPIFIGAFYLFFLNSVFIALSTYLIVRFLRFPLIEPSDQASQKRTRLYILALAFAMVIPSSFIMINVIQKLRTERSIKFFIETHVDNDFHKVVDFEHKRTDSLNFIKLYMAGAYMSEDSIAYLTERLEENGLKNYVLQVAQSVAPLEEDEITARTKLEVLKAIEANQEKVDEKELEIASLREELERIKNDSIPFQQVSREIKSVFPRLQQLGFAQTVETDFERRPDTIPIFLIQWDRNLGRTTRRSNEAKLAEFLEKRLGLDTLKLVNF